MYNHKELLYCPSELIKTINCILKFPRKGEVRYNSWNFKSNLWNLKLFSWHMEIALNCLFSTLTVNSLTRTELVWEILFHIWNTMHNYSLKVKPWNKLKTIPMSNIIIITSQMTFKRNNSFNSSTPSAAYMRQWIVSALVQIIACRLFGATPLSEPILGYDQLDSNSSEILVKTRTFSYKKIRLKMYVEWHPFCSG